MGVLGLRPPESAGEGTTAAAEALERGRRMIAEGADLVEVCCTPPEGGPPVGFAAWGGGLERLVASVAGEVPVAVACASPEAAAPVASAGASLIVDRSPPPAVARRACAGDAATLPAVAAVAAESGIGWVAVHSGAWPPVGGGASPEGGATPNPNLKRALESLADRAAQAAACGVEEIYLDPGIGTGRAGAADLELLAGLGRLAGLGHPLVLGTGDGLLIDELHAAADGVGIRASQHGAGPPPTVPGDETHDAEAARLEGALVMAVWAMLAGVAIIRTPHVAATVEAARVVGAKQPVEAL